MKVLLIGSGGREHAIAYKLRQSSLLTELKVYPGNGGFPESEILPADSMELKNKSSVQNFVKSNSFAFVIVGPEEPLVNGISDWMDEIGIPCFGPSAYCSRLEGSKDFAKSLMSEFSIPTAKYSTFFDYSMAIDYVKKHPLPVVIKADGLAAGKGVAVCSRTDEALQFLKKIFEDKKFGNSGSQVVIEEFLEGQEASLFAICDGERFLLFPASQDHKRAYDNDEGPNTGGMGAYAPAPIVTPEVLQQVKEKIFQPMISGLRKKNQPYKGLLYAGLMINSEGIAKVVEFNCRFGDPETQALMLLLEEDLLKLMWDAANGQLESRELNIKEGFATVVVLAANGYPETYKKNIPLTLKATSQSEIQVFHAGTIRTSNGVVSSGGRILGITSHAKTLAESVQKCYRYLAENSIPDTFYRKDIAKRAL
jgi:phosphoribosylamine--glycine ligase